MLRRDTVWVNAEPDWRSNGRLQPLDLGEVLRPLPPDDELLEDMRDA